MDDLKSGICYNMSCSKIHLTNKGIKSLNEYQNMKKEKNNNKDNNLNKQETVYESIRWIDDYESIVKEDDNKNKVNHVMDDDNKNKVNHVMDDDIIENIFKISKHMNDIYDDITDDDDIEIINKVKHYLNDNSDSDDCNRSIFD